MSTPKEEMAPAGRRDRLKAWLKLGASLLLLSFLAGSLVLSQSIKSKAKVGSPLPPWRGITDLEGREFAFQTLLGKPFIINITTTWCISCKEEAPVLEAFHRRYGDRMRLVAVDVREPVDVIRSYVRDFGLTYTMLRDAFGNISSPYNVRGYPETWFADAAGVARVYWEGPLNFEQMQEFYQQTTGEPIDGRGVGPVVPGDDLLALVLSTQGSGLLAGTERGLFAASGLSGLGEAGAWVEAWTGGAVLALAGASGPGTLFAAAGDGGLLLSQDGRVWRRADGLEAKPVTVVAASGRLVYAWARGLWRSDDGGSSWRQVQTSLPPMQVRSLAVSPADPRRLLLVADGRLFRSEDGGRSWRPVAVEELNFMPRWPGRVDLRPAVFAAAFDPGEAGTVYLATEKGIWKSREGGPGATWLRRSPMRIFTAVAAAPAPGGVVLVAGAPNGDVYVSEDRGASWRLVTR